MKQDRYNNIFSQLEFGHYSQLNSSSEVLPIDKKDIGSQADVTGSTDNYEKGTMVALGFIAILLIFSGMQLYRSINLNSILIETKKSQKTSVLKSANRNNNSFEKEIHLTEYKKLSNLEKHKILTIQNIISQGKF